MAEQQRAKSEIEAALTIAAARPRDEKMSLDKILNSCQRVGLAAHAEYQYSRGGTDIVGATIDLMEVVAMHWGNIEYGFRELARYPGVGGKPGESVVEAFAWDLQGNTKRRTQFTVNHVIGRRSGDKVLTDARDVYELVANQAQRRVRVCLENIIPCDIVEDAVNQCRATLKTKDPVTPEKVEAMVKWFADHGVPQEALETRIQRHMDSLTSAQMQSMRRIVRSIKDGVSQPSDWFELDTEPQASAADKAKAAMRKTAKKGAEQDEPPQPEPAPDPQPDADLPAAQKMTPREEYLAYVADADTPELLDSLAQSAPGDLSAGDLEVVEKAIDARKTWMTRGERSNQST